MKFNQIDLEFPSFNKHAPDDKISSHLNALIFDKLQKILDNHIEDLINCEMRKFNE